MVELVERSPRNDWSPAKRSQLLRMLLAELPIQDLRSHEILLPMCVEESAATVFTERVYCEMIQNGLQCESLQDFEQLRILVVHKPAPER
jgi:hypothetical protein